MSLISMASTFARQILSLTLPISISILHVKPSSTFRLQFNEASNGKTPTPISTHLNDRN